MDELIENFTVSNLFGEQKNSDEKYILCGKYDRAYYKYFKKNEKNEIIEPNKLY